MQLYRLALLLPLVALGTPARAAEDPAPDMRDLIERFQVDDEDLRSFYRVPFSSGAAERRNAHLIEWMKRLDELAPQFDALDRASQVDFLLLRNHVAASEVRLSYARARDAETLILLPFARELTALEESRRRLEPVDPRAAADALDAARKLVAEARRRADPENGKDDDAISVAKHVAYRAAGAVDRLRGSLKEWFTYRDGYEPEFGWWTRKPHAELDKALRDYAKYLREKLAGVKSGGAAPLVGDPIGRDALVAEIGFEMIPYSPEELLAIAEQQFAWCEAEARKASEELGLEGDWKRTVEHVKGLHAAPGRMDDLVATQARAAIAFVKDRDLATIPPLCEELWRLEMISAKGQKTLPFAAYSGNRMLVAYPTEGMSHESKLMSMRGNNEHFSRIVTPHELIPGHHLQLFMADRYATHRRLFRTPFLVEGWALYWEMRLWDLGWSRGPEDRVGMLFWRMHRCARIIVSLRFHLGDMTPQEMIDFLVERVGHEKDGATSEVRRYIAGAYGPLYQCAYMLGGLQLRALHGELVGAGKMTEREFHDTVLRQNSIPVDMVRAALTNAPLSADHTPSWRFAGDPE